MGQCMDSLKPISCDRWLPSRHAEILSLAIGCDPRTSALRVAEENRTLEHPPRHTVQNVLSAQLSSSQGIFVGERCLWE